MSSKIIIIELNIPDSIMIYYMADETLIYCLKYPGNKMLVISSQLARMLVPKSSNLKKVRFDTKSKDNRRPTRKRYI